MGRETYEQVTARYKDYNFDGVPVEHKIIVTRNKDFKVPKGYVVASSPEEAVEYIKKAELTTLFLIGGGVLNAEFAKRKLITHVELTIVPYILGKGRPVLAPGDYEFGMTLLDVQQKSLGRVRLIYKVNH